MAVVRRGNNTSSILRNMHGSGDIAPKFAARFMARIKVNRVVYCEQAQIAAHRPSRLDIGCGSGGPSLRSSPLQAALNRQNREASAIEPAQRSRPERGLSDKARFVAEGLAPFEDGSFDVVCIDAILHLGDGSRRSSVGPAALPAVGCCSPTRPG
jgi:SAM-dependent methyltransferase